MGKKRIQSKGICQSTVYCEAPVGSDYCKGKLHPTGKPCPYYIDKNKLKYIRDGSECDW